MLVCVSRAAVSPAIVTALSQFCATTNVRDILGWCVPATDPCSWGGVTCLLPDTVMVLNLVNPLLNGTWPSLFDQQMAGLEQLHIASGEMIGTISTTFFARHRYTLKEFEIISSRITFDLDDISYLEAIQAIQLENAHPIGSMSASSPLFAPQLLTFKVLYSSIGGEFHPDYFLSSPQLRNVILRGNAFTGRAPDLCAHTIVVLDFSQNLFNEIPTCYTTFAGDTCDMRNNIKCVGTVPDNAPGQTCFFDQFPNAPFDICGVCGGTGTSCTDCAGVVSGTTTHDTCNVCGGDGTSCLDCAGMPFGLNEYDRCEVCGGTNDCLDCDGVPNGPATGDVCGVCNGDGTSCFDCQGVMHGTTGYDACDVCGGDGSTCPDCFGVPAGPARVDLCGVCGGFNACVDCRGIAHGGADYDRCGVCGGNDTSCGLDEVFDNTSGLNVWIIVTVSLMALLMILIAFCVYFR